jgi:arylsulfatase A-like enzyme
LHNYDHAVGLFLDYFLHSAYADNTILVFTTDHATYPEPDYRTVAGKDLKPYFVDRIPLLIDDPFHQLPHEFDAAGRNSLDLAPTLLQLLGIRTARNSFLGHSLFEPRSFATGFTALGSRFYLTTTHGIFSAEDVPQSLQPLFACEAHVVREYYEAEAANRLASAPAQTTRPTATGAP